MTRAEFLDALTTYALLCDANVTSYGRTPAHNREVGGVALSAHIFWLAADVVYDAPVPEEARLARAARLGLRCIQEGDHDHLQPLDWARS